MKGKVKMFNTHRLVAEAFIPNPNKHPLVMHIDNDGLNNNVSNLKWGTYKMNNIQPVIEGRAANQYGKYGRSSQALRSPSTGEST